ncbi:MAG TPA: hypothetical protein VK338_02180 [Candidatus Nitrosocosmicus sp.]|nr:hypothetical protein [Candidatus Nitrosocosmicus sp.]
MERQCEYMCVNSKECALKDDLEHQNHMGGNANQDLTSDRGGPFWERSNWNNFTERTKDATSKVNCLISDEIEKIAEQITAEKEANGELI